MGLNYFIYNGESSLDHGVYVGGQGTYGAPQRDINKVSIPGRNGDLVRDNGRWLNISVPYNIVIMHDFLERSDDIRAWLSEPTGYVRLEDTYHPDQFRLAKFNGPIDFTTAAYNNAGKTKIIFDCKPQRFLKSGETKVQMENGGFVINPTRYESNPLIIVYGSGDGTILVNDTVITITGMSGYLYIDCEIKDCYKDDLSVNNQVTLRKFPVFNPGRNGVAWTGGVTGVTVQGRWFTV